MRRSSGDRSPAITESDAMTVLPDWQMYSDGEQAHAAAGDRRPRGRQMAARPSAEGEPEAASQPADTDVSTRTAEPTDAASAVATGDAFNRAPTPAVGANRRIGVPPPAAGASKPPPADHELGAGQAPPPPPRYWRPRILSAAAAAAFIALVGIIVSIPGGPGIAPDGTTGTSTPWSASFSMIATGWWTPDPPAPPPTATQPAAPPPAEAPAAASPRAASTAAPPPVAAPPPPPPPELTLRYGEGRPDGIPAFVSITNNANKPAVGCSYRAVAVAGEATLVNYVDTVNFTVAGSAETRLDRPGPATGSSWHVTVTCDNGLSTSQDVVY